MGSRVGTCSRSSSVVQEVVSMKCGPLGLLLLVVAVALGVASDLSSDGPKNPDRADQAVVLWEMRVTETAALRAKVVATVDCGEMVTVLGPREERKARVKANGATGWVHLEGLVELSAPGADARLLAAAHEKEMPSHWSREPEHLAALALYSRHMEIFPDSEYAALALYRFGQAADRLAVEAIREAEQQLTQEQRAYDRAYTDWQGLEKYAKWGLTFDYSHLGGYYFHGGAVYRKVAERHGDSEWADNAAFRLLELVGEQGGGWEGHPQEPLKKLDLWAEFVRKYPRSELKPEALLEMVYLNRVLHEIHSHSTAGFADPGKAERRLEAARTLCDTVRREFPSTIFAARAERHLAELAEGRHVYFFGAGIG